MIVMTPWAQGCVDRGFPLVLYEEPFVAIFRQRHGEDPRQIAAAEHPTATTNAARRRKRAFMRAVVE